MTIGRVDVDHGAQVGEERSEEAGSRDEWLAEAIASADSTALARALLAVLALHQPDEHGRCRVCLPVGRYWWPVRRPTWCPTRSGVAFVLGATR